MLDNMVVVVVVVDNIAVDTVSVSVHMTVLHIVVVGLFVVGIVFAVGYSEIGIVAGNVTGMFEVDTDYNLLYVEQLGNCFQLIGILMVDCWS